MHPQTITIDTPIGFPSSFCDESARIGEKSDLGEGVGATLFSGDVVG